MPKNKFLKIVILSLAFTGCAHFYKVQELKPTHENVQMILNDKTLKLRSCVQSDLDNEDDSENFSGKINVELTVGENGYATKAEIVSKDVSSDVIIDCLKKTLSTIEFPHPGIEKTYEFRGPLTFYPNRTE